MTKHRHEEENKQAEIKDEKDQQIEDLTNKLLRALADFDNYKKRSNMEREELSKFANEAFILNLLPVIDGFERAMKSFPPGESEEVIKGIALIKKQFADVLERFGVKPVETLGKAFDPHLAEAIMQKESDQPKHMVIEEMQKGYTLHGRLIRPAMVIVSKGKE